ncbi:MAG: PA2778 family cysteine peptidase [Gammaproteobacteria bacterium]
MPDILFQFHALRKINPGFMHCLKHAGFQWSLPLLVLSVLTGCAAPQTRLVLEQPSTLPERASVAGVPFYPQEKYYCGPASLAMMLNWAGIPAEQHDIASQIYTPGREGTLTPDVLAGARRNGALSVEVSSLHNLLAEIAAGNPVMVFQNLGVRIYPQWHFAVATGYDLDAENLFLHSGLDPQRVLNINSFERTWQRADYWAITVTPPDQLPSQASEMAVLKGAAGLERAGQYPAAITAYQTVLQRWPVSTIARMGLGNTYYKLGKYSKAAAAFREVIVTDNSHAAAWNNLANALAEQTLYDEAINAARKAVTLNKDNEIYRTTLAETKAKQSSFRLLQPDEYHEAGHNN